MMPAVITMTFEEYESDLILGALHYLQGGLLSRDPMAEESLMHLSTPPTEYDIKALKARFEHRGEALWAKPKT